MLDPHMHRNALYPHVHLCIADALYLDVHPQFLVASASVEWIGGVGVFDEIRCACVRNVHSSLHLCCYVDAWGGSWELGGPCRDVEG